MTVQNSQELDWTAPRGEGQQPQPPSEAQVSSQHTAERAVVAASDVVQCALSNQQRPSGERSVVVGVGPFPRVPGESTLLCLPDLESRE